jgi:hypothetical protein
MSDDIEQRLAAAAQAVREYEVCGQHCSDLRERQQATAAALSDARLQYAGEQKDVERLEGLSLVRVLASLHGSRGDALARDKAEAQAAQYRVTEAEAKLTAVNTDLAAAEARQNELANAPQAYANALADKEKHLTQSTDPRGAQLLKLAEERGRLTAEINELRDAQQKAGAASQALASVRDRLGTASDWSDFDTVFGGGMIGNAIKHDRIDQAAAAASEADRRLAALRTELADLGQLEPTAPRLDVSGGLKFADIFFNNIFTDLAVGHQIRQAQANVGQSAQVVAGVSAQLAAQMSQAQARLAANESQRSQLLTA